MTKMVDLTGRKYGRWTVKEFDIERSKKSPDNPRKVLYWICECECGTIRSVAGNSLKYGESRSCGCKDIEYRKKLHKIIEPYMYDGTNIIYIRNKKTRSDNTSGVCGVCFNKITKKWIATITLRGKTYYKEHKLFNDAVKCRQEMEELLFEPVIAKFNESRMMKR